MRHEKQTMVLFGVAAWLLSQGLVFAHLSDGSAYPPLTYSGFLADAAGVTYTDAIFGTQIKRISDAVRTPHASGGRFLEFVMTEYSSMSAFSEDGSRLILQHDGYYGLYDGNGTYLGDLPFEIHASSEPRWSRGSARVLYFIDGNQLKRHDVDSGATAVVHAFSEYSSISGRGESDISFDGDHFVFVGDDQYVLVYTISSGAESAVFDTGGRGFDSVHITPDNNVTVTWLQAGYARYNGIELFDGSGGMRFVHQLTAAGGHMDVGRDDNGDEVLLWANAADPVPLCDNGVVKVRIADARQTCLASFDWSLALNVSAPDNSGWVFVATYAPGDPDPLSGSWPAHTNEIVQVNMDGSEVRRLAHHRSRPFNGYNYTPRPTISRDGRKVVFNSNFGMQESGYPTQYADAYLIDLDLPVGSTGTSPPATSSDLAAPTSFVATVVESGRVDLTWVNASSATNAFKLQRKLSGGTWGTIDWPAADQTSYSDTGLSAGNWCYRIRAHGPDGFTVYVTSAPVCVTVAGDSLTPTSSDAPAAPSSLLATAVSSSRIDLTWTDNANDENASKLQRKPAGGSWTTVDWPAANQTSYADKGLSAGDWCYRIRAHGSDGFSAYVESTPACVTVGGGDPPTTSSGAPAAPSNVQATAVSSSSIDVTWTDNADNESSFKLQRKASGGAWTTVDWPAANQTSYADKGLSAGDWCYRIRAHGSDGFSAYVESTPACVTVGGGDPPTTSSGAPAVPSNVQAAAVSSSSIDVTWTDNADNESSFKLQRKASGGAWTTVDWPAANQTSYADTGLSAGTWCYRIRSHSADGFSSYVESPCVTLGGDDGSSLTASTPNAPNQFAAVSPAGSNRVDLTWKDNSDDEHSFKLQWTPAGTSNSQTIWIFSDVTSFSHVGLASGVSYCYRIRSHNLNGFSEYVLSQPNCVTVGSGSE